MVQDIEDIAKDIGIRLEEFKDSITVEIGSLQEEVKLLGRAFENELQEMRHKLESAIERLGDEGTQDITILGNTVGELGSIMGGEFNNLTAKVETLEEKLVAFTDNYTEDHVQLGRLVETLEQKLCAVLDNRKERDLAIKRLASTVEGLDERISSVLANDTQTHENVNVKLTTLQKDTNSTLYLLGKLEQKLNNFVLTSILPRSCSELDPSSPSGYYLVNWNRASVYCDMDRQSCGCGSTRGWMRVADIDMTDPNQQCPTGFRLRLGTPRLCEMTRSSGGCTSVIFPTHSMRYSRVCGRIKAYQYGSPDAFQPYQNDRSHTIDSMYVEGVSITHGQSPRKHIWTFAAAVDETRTTDHRSTCPCTKSTYPYRGAVPPFIGNDYFCDTGSSSAWSHRLYSDALWDGEGCGYANTCCQFNSPPWFCKELPQPTTDNIEFRMCRQSDRSNEDTPFELVELYVQ